MPEGSVFRARTKNEIFQDIKNKYLDRTGKDINNGPVLTMYSDAVSEVLEEVYEEIDKVKNPFIFSDIHGIDLDKIGFFINLPRERGEGDESYRYRLMNWSISLRKSNKTAIEDALVNIDRVSDAKFIPKTHGSGTGTIFIVPEAIEYEEEAYLNVQRKIEDVVSPGLHIEYVFPKMKEVEILAYMRSDEGDLEFIRRQLEEEFKEYINNIPPGENLEVGELKRAAYNKKLVNFFSILEIRIDGESHRQVSITQESKSKFICKEESIHWEIER